TDLDAVIVSPRKPAPKISTVQHSNPSSPSFSNNLVALEYTFNRLDTENDPYVCNQQHIDQRLSGAIAS
ncbi:hypothetical protein GYMLUDRAFT_50283, partial [Collybiopsis luxurians FD-317 M1]